MQPRVTITKAAATYEAHDKDGKYVYGAQKLEWLVRYLINNGYDFAESLPKCSRTILGNGRCQCAYNGRCTVDDGCKEMMCWPI